MKKISSYSGGILLLLIIFSACKKYDNKVTRIPSAGLMAFNLATDKDAVGISLSGNNLTNTPLSYTSFTGGYYRYILVQGK